MAAPTPAEIDRHPLRPFFVNGEDLKIADVLFRYFSAVRDRWPVAWSSTEKGVILNRTNGFRALMRALRQSCKTLKPHKRLPTKEDFDRLLQRVAIDDEEFTVDNFKPGTSGESLLYSKLVEGMGLEDQQRLI